jgi:M-phase inducer tyrosine phosphatase
MDLDSPCPRPPATLFIPAISAPPPQLNNFHNSSNKPSNDVLGTYFYDESPEPINRTSAFPITARKARPASPEPAALQHVQLSSSPSSSPAARKFERSLSAQLGQPTVKSKEMQPQCGGLSFRQPKPRLLSVAFSTKDIAPQPRSAGIFPSTRARQLAPRRAVSAFIQPGFGVPSGMKQSRLRAMAAFGDDDDGELGAETGDFDSPITKVKVGRMAKVASLGGTSDMKASGSRLSPVPSFGRSPGLPRFGDNEMDGKILPCQRVKDDGLVRITPHTVRSMVCPTYESC